MDIYSLNFKNPGRVFILFNSRFFSENEKDVLRLNDTLTKLNFKVNIYVDKTADELKTCIKDMSENDYENVGCVLVFIMSHGDDYKIFGIDGEAVNLTDFLDPFESKKSLKGKPKLFFFNACRGKSYSSIHQDTLDQEEMNTQENIQLINEMIYTPNGPDFLYSFSDFENGSMFIQILCDMIEKYKSTKHILDMLTCINKEMTLKEGRGTKMMSTNTRDFYFSQPTNVHFILFFSIF